MTDIDTSRLRALAEEVKAASWSRSLAVELDWATATKPAAIIALLDRLEAAEVRTLKAVEAMRGICMVIAAENSIIDALRAIRAIDAQEIIDAALSASEGAKS